MCRVKVNPKRIAQTHSFGIRDFLHGKAQLDKLTLKTYVAHKNGLPLDRPTWIKLYQLCEKPFYFWPFQS